MTEAAKPRADWEAIERDYRAGVLSLREIAKQHGLSDTAIRKRAKVDGWERDLSDRVQEKVRTELVRTEVRTANPEERATERQIVDAAAAQVVHVVREHRSAIKEGQDLARMLMTQLKEVVSNREDIEQAIKEATAGDENEKRYSALMKMMSIPTHTSAVVNLANAMKTWIGLERQAFNIGDEPPAASDSLTALLDHIKTTGSRLPIKPQGDKQ